MYDNKIDVWSAGVLLFVMLSGTQPFSSDNISKLINKITDKSNEPNYLHEAFNYVTAEALDLLK